jgi:acetyl-CoA carboxylase biotin carboxyl carrier protein
MNSNVRRSDWNRLLDEALPAILDSVAGTDVEEVTLTTADTSVRVRLQADPVADREQADAAEAEADGAAVTVVLSRNVGVFRRGEAAEGEMAVAIGSEIEAGQTIGFIDTLDHYHPVGAVKAGELLGFLVEDGAPVEYGQELARILPR